MSSDPVTPSATPVVTPGPGLSGDLPARAAALAELGAGDDTMAAFARLGAPHLWLARVARVDRAAFDVLPSAAGSDRSPDRATLGAAVLAAAAGMPAAAPAVGDWVGLRTWPDRPTTVEAVLARRTALVRGAASGRSVGQVLAANIDVVFLVVSLAIVPDLGRLERLLAIAWDSGAAPVVLMTKADLVRDAGQVAEDVIAAAPGVPVLAVSALTGDGMDEIRAQLAPGRTAVMVGPSGVGKSTLANVLCAADRLATAEIRPDGKGRHTTTARQLMVLPGGGVLIDTPGLRGVALGDDSGVGVASVFADVEELAAGCRFGDCGHRTEPGCAVLAAVADQRLSLRRLESWRKLAREADWMASRVDARLAAERRRNWRMITRAQRSAPPRGSGR